MKGIAYPTALVPILNRVTNAEDFLTNSVLLFGSSNNKRKAHSVPIRAT